MTILDKPLFGLLDFCGLESNWILSRGTTLRVLFSSLCLLLGAAPALAGCGSDRILERADEERADEGIGSEGTTPGRAVEPPPGAAEQPAPGSVGDPEPGQAGDPNPGDPAQPPPGAPDQPNPGIPEEPEPAAPGAPGGAERAGGTPSDGPTVTLKGEIRYRDYSRGKISLDVFDGDQRDFSARPSVVGRLELDAPGPFELAIPQGAGKVWISAYNDANDDGKPDHEDPTGFCSTNPVALDDQIIEGLVIQLEYNPPPEGQ